METIKSLLCWIAAIETGRAAAAVWAAAAIVNEKFGSAPIHALLGIGLWLICMVLFAVSIGMAAPVVVSELWKKRKSV